MGDSLTSGLSKDTLRNMFIYKDGKLSWRETRNSRAVKGKVAGCLDSSHGYVEIRINNKRYYAHRLVWQYHYGPIPKGFTTDHINHNRSDNRIENLRLVDHRENHRNQKMRKNTSVFNGVGFDKQRSKWQARIMVDGKNLHLGRFATLTEAISMRLFANSFYSFHENHGKTVGVA